MKRHPIVLALAGWLLFHAPTPPLAGAEVAKPTVPIPPAINILTSLNKPHPRLLATKEDFAQLDAQILSPAGAKFQVLDAQPLPSSPHPEKQAGNERVRKLAIHLIGISDCRIAVLLVPKPSRDEAASQTEKLSALSEW